MKKGFNSGQISQKEREKFVFGRESIISPAVLFFTEIFSYNLFKSSFLPLVQKQVFTLHC